MNVYKYLHPDRVDVLKNGMLRFSQPAALNDPFEVRPNLELVRQDFAYLRRSLAPPGLPPSDEDMKFVDDSVTEFFGQWNENNVSNLGILSLSSNRNNHLMWAHYCDSHRGFVVGFEMEHPFFLSAYGRKGVLHHVRYADERPIFPAPSDPNAEMFFRLNKGVLTKSTHWSYENELRMCADTGAADGTGVAPNGQELYLIKFPPEILREVIFGFRLLPDERTAITKIAQESYPNAQLFQMELSEKTYDLTVSPYLPVD